VHASLPADSSLYDVLDWVYMLLLVAASQPETVVASCYSVAILALPSAGSVTVWEHCSSTQGVL
jgi:hypothetical protein